MADNRLWLIHRPTGLGIMLGKVLASPWYTAGDDMTRDMDRYFAVVAGESEDYGRAPDFILAAETAVVGDAMYQIGEYPPPIEGERYRRFNLSKLVRPRAAEHGDRRLDGRPLQAYRITEYDWYAGRDLLEAMAAAMRDSDEALVDDVVDMDVFTGEPERGDMKIHRDDGTTETVAESLAKMDGPGWCFGIDA